VAGRRIDHRRGGGIPENAVVEFTVSVLLPWTTPPAGRCGKARDPNKWRIR